MNLNEDTMRPESLALWPYFLLLIAAVLAWGAYLHFSLKPDVIVTQSGTPFAKLAYYFVPPLIALLALYTAHSVYRGNQQQAWDGQQAAKQAEIEKQKQAAMSAEEKERQRQQFTLEVVGSGIAIESLRQMKIWEVIEKAPPHTDAYVVPEKQYGSDEVYSEANGKRSEDVLQYGAFWFAEKWPIPTMDSSPRSEVAIKQTMASLEQFEKENPNLLTIPTQPDTSRWKSHPYSVEAFMKEALHPAAFSSSILAWHKFTGVDFEPSGVSDRLLQDIFNFFDDNNESPALYLNSEDDEIMRDRRLRHPKNLPFVLPQYQAFTHTRAMRSAAYVGLMFARRDRIEWLKPYATVPGDPPGALASLEKWDNDTGPNEGFTVGEDYVNSGAIPAWPAWARGLSEGNNSLIPFWDKATAPKTPFKPTQWLPKPWRRGQIVMFETLPVMGRVHRPQTVDYRDPKAQIYPQFRRPASTPAPKLVSGKERERLFALAWVAALKTLPEGKQPARLFHNLGPSPMKAAPNNQPLPSDPKWFVPLHLALVSSKSDITADEMYNLPKMLGELGAATPFVSISVALMAAYKLDQPMAVVNFHPEGATILMITPPTQEERKQKHPGKNAIDPFTWTPFGDTPEAQQK